MRKKRKPIIVTGMNRSGTTWIGQMIATSPNVGYIHEPFNLDSHPGICNAPFEFWFSYVSRQNEAHFYPSIRKTLNFRYNLLSGLKTVKSKESFVVFYRTWKNTKNRSNLRLIPLMKDPVAIFSVEWLASRFNMDVVATMRHPAAYVSSLKRLNWYTYFPDFLAQPLLMQDHLSPFEREIKDIASKPHSIIENAILSWKIMFSVLQKYKSRHPEWIFLRHEDISMNPLFHFKFIFQRLRINFTESIAQNIATFSKDKISNDDRQPFDIKRNSMTNISIWKNRLTKNQIHKIRTELESTAYPEYSDSDW